MKLLEDHPVVKNIGVLIAFLALITMAGKAWIFLEVDNARNDKWMELDEQWNAAQLAKLEEISKAMATQGETLGRLQKDYSALMQAFYESQNDVHYRIGVHAGRHMQPAHKGGE